MRIWSSVGSRPKAWKVFVEVGCFCGDDAVVGEVNGDGGGEGEVLYGL